MKKIAVVVQRYGLEVNGGAELYARQIAEKLKDKYYIEVITTCAIDYVTWKNEYMEGYEYINGILVRRFKVDKQRNNKRFNELCSRIIPSPEKNTKKDEEEWMIEQGPTSSKLIEFLKGNHEQYDRIMFMTYLYYTTYFGLQIAPEKSILVSMAHDEPPIYLNIFKEIFHLPKYIFYLTDEEMKFVNKKFNNSYIDSEVLGVGIDIPQGISAERFRTKYNITEKFILYIGRIDESKGCRELFEYFRRYKNSVSNNIKLVLMGKEVIDVPKDDNIISLGFVTDEDKFDGINACELLVNPSKFESLSMVVLESMKLGKPVLVNGECEVLKGHCIKSNAGLYYENYCEFEESINFFINNTIVYNGMKSNCKKYIEERYSWDKVTKKLYKVI